MYFNVYLRTMPSNKYTAIYLHFICSGTILDICIIKLILMMGLMSFKQLNQSRDLHTPLIDGKRTLIFKLDIYVILEIILVIPSILTTTKIKKSRQCYWSLLMIYYYLIKRFLYNKYFIVIYHLHFLILQHHQI